MKIGDVIRQICVNNTFYLTGIFAHKVNHIHFYSVCIIVPFDIKHFIIMTRDYVGTT